MRPKRFTTLFANRDGHRAIRAVDNVGCRCAKCGGKSPRGNVYRYGLLVSKRGYESFEQLPLHYCSFTCALQSYPWFFMSKAQFKIHQKKVKVYNVR